MNDHHGFDVPGYVPYHGSPGPSNGERTDAFSRVYEDLQQRMREPKDKKRRHDRFLTDDDIDTVYADRDRIRALIKTTSRNVDLEKVRIEMRRVITVLILIGARDCFTDFERRLYRQMTPDITDKDLPITRTSDLHFLPTDQRDRFMHEQYAVLAVKIKEDYEPRTLRFGPKERLPFERIEERIGVGGYGKVDKVWIPRGYLEDRNRHLHTVVACKRFKVEDEFAREVGNVEMLKARLTSHSHIMLHLITLVREETCFILLPFAAKYDLGMFLRSGFDDTNKKVYDFQFLFPHIGRPDGTGAHQVTTNLFLQAYGIADALRWLHNDVSGKNSTDRLYCLHMDLRPANVLVDDPVSPTSTVGTWKISDFGISVFREATHQQDSNVVSPLDYVERLTAKTRPKRTPGSYTAPEVDGTEASVGRGNDVWSFACLFSEVIVFALGRDVLVQEFRDIRKSQCSNDRFYMPQPRHHLAQPSTSVGYQLKSDMIDWLYTLPNRFPVHSGWLACFTNTILGMLVINTSQRPSSTDLPGMVRHLRHHCDAVSAGQPIACGDFTSRAMKPSPPAEPAAYRGSRSDSIRKPSLNLERSQHQGLRINLSNARFPLDSAEGPSIRRVSTSSRETLHRPSRTQMSSPVSPLKPATSPGTPNFPQAREPRSSSSIGSSPSMSTIMSPSMSTTMLPSLGPGIKVMNTREFKTPVHSHWHFLAQKASTATDISICPGGQSLACLVKSTVFIYKFDGNWSSTQGLAPKILPPDVRWEHVTIAGDFVAVWGRIPSTGQKEIRFANVQGSELIYGPPHKEVPALKSVHISDSGAVALLCQHCLVYTSIESRGDQDRLDLDKHRVYGSAGFGCAGKLLHTWILGPQGDQLKTWGVEDGTLALTNASVRDFARSDSVESPRLFPYTDRSAVIIEAPRTKFFSSSATKSSRASATTVIGHVHTARIHNDCTFITVEAGSKLHHGRIKEYAISNQGGQSLSDGAQEIGKLRHIRPMNDGPLAMFVTSYRSTDSQTKAVLIVASATGVIEALHYG